MPAGDRTGPDGVGPITGRGAGFCMGFNVPGYLNPRVQFGGGRGRGFGRGFGGGLGRFGAGGLGAGWRHRHSFRANPGYMQDDPMDYRDYNPAPYSEPEVNREQQVKYLKAQAKNLERSLKQINREIAELNEPEQPETKP